MALVIASLVALPLAALELIARSAALLPVTVPAPLKSLILIVLGPTEEGFINARIFQTQ